MRSACPTLTRPPAMRRKRRRRSNPPTTWVSIGIALAAVVAYGLIANAVAPPPANVPAV